MVSRVLSEIGVFMGTALTPNSNEDKEFQSLVKARDYVEFARLASARDQRHAVWGFKSPGLRSDLSGFSPHLRNPRLIVTFRDILAIAVRNSSELNTDVAQSLRTAAISYSKLIIQLEKLSCPIMMISYEKALQFPENTVSEIAGFCGVNLSDEQTTVIARSILNGDDRYLLGGTRGLSEYALREKGGPNSAAPVAGAGQELVARVPQPGPLDPTGRTSGT